MRDKELPKEQVDNVDDLLHTINGLIELANGEVVVLQEQEPTEEPVPEVDWDSLREKGFFEPQLQEIDLGLKYHLAVGIYAKECYNWRQMSEIRMGLMSGLDVQFYTNPLFTAEQMREIRLGLEENLDISEYAVPAMQWLCGEGIMSGSDGNLMPMGNATRAQVAAFLHRFCENIL